VVDWWNGGRVEIFDDAATIRHAVRYRCSTAPPKRIDPAALNKTIKDNAFVESVEGDCGDLKMIQEVWRRFR